MPMFDLMSDAHIDFWVSETSDLSKMENRVQKFIGDILPENPSRTLIIAGDMANRNLPARMLVEGLKRIYPNILIVFGNHDYYLPSKNMIKRYKKSSKRRTDELEGMFEGDDSVHFLKGSVITIEGVTYGGTSGWYDFSYGKNKGMGDDAILNLWRDHSNDSKWIKGMYVTPVEYFEKERECMKAVLPQVDVMITHVPPEPSHLECEDDDDEEEFYRSFYLFDGASLLDEFDPAVWCFGHTHVACDFQSRGTRFISNPIGYPESRTSAPTRIKGYDSQYSASRM